MAGGNVSLTVRIGGEYSGKRAIKAATTDLEKLKRFTGKMGEALNVNIGNNPALNKFGKGLTGAAARFGILSAAVTTAGNMVTAFGEALDASAKKAGQLKALELRIDGIKSITEEAAARTAGFFNSTEIQNAAARLDAFGINAALTGEVLEEVAKTSVRLGTDASHALNSLVEGVSKQSAPRLDNLGITKDAVVSQAELAAATNQTTDAISREAAVTATMTKALEQLRGKNAAVGDLQQTQLSSIKRLTTGYEELKQTVMGFAADAAVSVIDFFTGTDREMNAFESALEKTDSTAAKHLKAVRLHAESELERTRRQIAETKAAFVDFNKTLASGGLGGSGPSENEFTARMDAAKTRALATAQKKVGAITQTRLRIWQQLGPSKNKKALAADNETFQKAYNEALALEEKAIRRDLKRAARDKKNSADRRRAAMAELKEFDKYIKLLDGMTSARVKFQEIESKFNEKRRRFKETENPADAPTKQEQKAFIDAREFAKDEDQRYQRFKARSSATKAEQKTRQDVLRLERAGLALSEKSARQQQIAVVNIDLEISQLDIKERLKKREITASKELNLQEQARLEAAARLLDIENAHQQQLRARAKRAASDEKRRREQEARARLNALPEAARIQEGFRARAQELVDARSMNFINDPEFSASLAEVQRDQEAVALDQRLEKMRQFTTATQEMSAALANHQDTAVQAIGRSLQAFDANLEGIAKGGPAAIVGIGNVIGAALGDMRAAWAVQSIAELAAGFATLVTNPIASAGHFTASALYATAAATSKPSRSAASSRSAGGQTSRAITPAETRPGGGGATYVINSPIVIGGSDQEIGAKFQRIMKAPAGTGRGAGAV